MQFVVDQPIDLEKLKQDLSQRFPEYEIKHAPFNKKTLRVVKGMSQVVIGQRKNGKVICAGNINMLDWRFMVPFVLFLAAILISGFVFLIIMSLIKKKEFKALEAEIATYLQEYFST